MSHKIIGKTIKKAYQHWNPCKEIRTYHYAAAFDKSKMIGFAQNNPIKTHTNAYRIGRSLNLSKYKKYQFYNSESHLVSKLLNRYNFIDYNWSIVVMRINREGRILGSKPCNSCQKLLSSVGLSKIFYSTDDSRFVCSNRDKYFDPLGQ